MNTEITQAPAELPQAPYPAFEQDLAKLCDRAGANAEAAAAPLPGPMRDAFAADPLKVHGFTLQPVTFGHDAILERISSPLLKIIAIYRRVLKKHLVGKSAEEIDMRSIAEETTRLIEDEIKSDPEENAETVFVFLHNPPKLRAMLNKGRQFFREQVMAELGDKHHPAVINDLARAVAAHYMASFATAVQYQRAPEDGEEGFPSPPSSQATGSAGGSTSSAK